jgi:hypothetical protein
MLDERDLHRVLTRINTFDLAPAPREQVFLLQIV